MDQVFSLAGSLPLVPAFPKVCELLLVKDKFEKPGTSLGIPLICSVSLPLRESRSQRAYPGWAGV